MSCNEPSPKPRASPTQWRGSTACSNTSADRRESTVKRRPCALVLDSGVVLASLVPHGTTVILLAIALGEEALRDGVGQLA
jgi:hypothetical protein